MELTPATIRALELPSGVSEKTFFDDSLAGFGVRIRRSGSKSYVVQYKAPGGVNRRVPLGAVGSIDHAKAKRTAKDILAATRLGRDPVGEKLAERSAALETFGAMLPAYLRTKRAELKPRSLTEVIRFLEIYSKPLHNQPANVIDRRAVAIQLARIAERHGPGASNRMRAALSGYFSWLAREGVIESNPAAFTNKRPEAGARDRLLSGAELTAIWHCAGDDQFGAIAKLLLLTGCRRDEIGNLAWSEVSLENAELVLPGARTKNRKEHRVPLAPAALEILQRQPRRIQPDGEPRDLVFGYSQHGYSGWSKSQRELNTRLAEAGTPVENWWLHDFRRAMSTTMHDRLGIAPHVVEAVLNHVSGHKAGISAVYNKAAYQAQKRHALTAWADHVAALINGTAPAPNVTELAQYRK